MKRHAQLFVVAMASILLASCVASETPLSDEETSKVDDELIGTWHQVKSDGKPYSMTIGKKAGTRNVMEWVSISLNDKRQVQVKRYDVFARAGKTDYISIALNPKTNVIGKYELQNSKTFTLFLLDTQVLGKAVDAGELQGKANKKDTGDYSSVSLSGPPNKIHAYLEKNAAKCFAKEPIVYKKVGS